VEIEGWVDPRLPARDADAIGRQLAAALAQQLPEAAASPGLAAQAQLISAVCEEDLPDLAGGVVLAAQACGVLRPLIWISGLACSRFLRESSKDFRLWL
jgi:hypothetical protein